MFSSRLSYAPREVFFLPRSSFSRLTYQKISTVAVGVYSMENFSSAASFVFHLTPKAPTFSSVEFGFLTRKPDWEWKTSKGSVLRASAASYPNFVHFALSETESHTLLVPSRLQEKFNNMTAMDGETKLDMLSFEAPKVRLLRSMSIKNESMQVLDFAAFPKLELDVPIFCANFFTAANTNIIVLDLNPLHDVIMQRDYKEKYYRKLMPLGLKYAELLPWGGKLTSESIRFFSPIVIWTKFLSSQSKYDILYHAFVDYYKAWLELMDQAEVKTDPTQIMLNREAQHRYLTWRAQKDPGHGVLKKLIGEKNAKVLLREFLFNGVSELGNQTFLDYFPEYYCEDGSISKKRSVQGKDFHDRPWDAKGEFIPSGFRN